MRAGKQTIERFDVISFPARSSMSVFLEHINMRSTRQVSSAREDRSAVG
jgi:hypothetical protein